MQMNATDDDLQGAAMNLLERRWRYIGGPYTTTAEETIEPVGPVRKWPEEGEELVPASALEEAVEALDAALYFAENLDRIRNHKPVRDLTESHAAAVKARQTLERLKREEVER